MYADYHSARLGMFRTHACSKQAGLLGSRKCCVKLIACWLRDQRRRVWFYQKSVQTLAATAVSDVLDWIGRTLTPWRPEALKLWSPEALKLWSSEALKPWSPEALKLCHPLLHRVLSLVCSKCIYIEGVARPNCTNFDTAHRRVPCNTSGMCELDPDERFSRYAKDGQPDGQTILAFSLNTGICVQKKPHALTAQT